MAKNDFLDLTDVPTPMQTPIQTQAAQPLQIPQTQVVQTAQPSPVEQFNRQQAEEVMLAMQQAIAAETGKAQAQVWRSAKKGAMNLPATLLKLAQVTGLCLWVAHGDVLIEPLIHRTIAQHIITSAAVGDGTAAVFSEDKKFSELHWALQGKVNTAVNTLMAGIFILLLIGWEPANGDEAKFKFKLLIFLAVFGAPVILF
jgi:hypothetical protein